MDESKYCALTSSSGGCKVVVDEFIVEQLFTWTVLKADLSINIHLDGQPFHCK